MSDSMPHDWKEDEPDEGTFEDHQEIADAFGRTADPLAKYDEGFKSVSTDPFELFVQECLESRGRSSDTIKNYERTFRYWREHMKQFDRHPACPNEQHLRSFANWRVDVGNSNRYTIEMMEKLKRAFDFFQRAPTFPHETDYNPVYSILGKISLKSETPKEPRPLSKEELAEEIQAIKHVRDRAIVTLQCKCGLRVGELVNIQIQDIHVNHSDLLDHYDMGEAEGLDGNENALYVPTDRKGNKSERPRVIPLDEESRKVLLDYLQTRPDLDTPWLFLTDSGKQWNTDNVNELVWLEHFQPKWGETARFRGVTSHWGRHFFTTWFHERTDMTRSEVKYLRGDMQQSGDVPAEAINSYIHVYYDDVEDKYREQGFKLGL